MPIAKSQSPEASTGERVNTRLDTRFESLRRSAFNGGRTFRHGRLEVRWAPISRFHLDTADWRDLIKRAIEPNVFLEPAFALAAAESFGEQDMGVLTAYAGRQLVGLMAGKVEGFGQGRPVPVFVSWTHPFAPLSRPLLDRQAAHEAVPALLAALRELPGAPKAALFRLLPEAGVAARLMGLHLAGEGKTAARFNIHKRAALMNEDDDSWEMISARKRKELRRQRRRMSEAGHLEHEFATSTREVRAAVAEFLTVEERGWKGRAGSAASRDPGTAQFMLDAVAGLATERKARVDRLILDNKTAAAAITLYSGDYAWFWKTAYDEELSRFSPGVQIALDLTEALEADRNLALVDSCAVADHPMIDHLWAGRIAMADWLVPLDGTASFTAARLIEQARRMAAAPVRMLRDRFRR